MRATRYFRLLMVLLALGASTGLWASTTYTSRDGLSHNAVLALARDAQGFVWVGTEQGLDRFDGRSFKRIALRPGQDDAPASSYVTALHVQREHLWIGTLSHGLLRLDLVSEQVDAFVLPDAPRTAAVRALAQWADRLYVGTDGGGLYALSLTAATPVLEAVATDELAENRIWGLHAGPSGLWIATQDGARLMRTHGELSTPERLCGLPDCGRINVEDLREGVDGALWVGGWDHGLFRVPADAAGGDGAEVKRFMFGSEQGIRVLSLLGFESDEGWIGTDRGLWHWSADCDCVEPLGIRPDSRGGDVGLLVTSLLLNGRGGIYAGTWGEGLLRASTSDLLIERHDLESLGTRSREGTLRSLFRSRDGHLYAGFFGAGIHVSMDAQDALDWQPVPGPWNEVSRGARHVWVMAEDAGGALLAGTDDGLWRRAEGDTTWQRVALGQPTAAVRSLLSHADGALWVGTTTGLERRAADATSPQLLSAGDPDWAHQDANIYALEAVDGDRVAAGTWGGVILFDANGQALDALREGADALPDAMVWDLLPGSDGRLWIATAAGLCSTRVRAERFERPLNCVGTRSGLPSTLVYGLELETGADGDRIWMSTAFGLARFDPATSTARRWFRADGLIDDEFVVGAHLRDARGRLLFGGRGGLVRFDPVALAQLPPQLGEVRLADVLQAGLELGVGGETGSGLRLVASAPYLGHLALSPGDHWIGFRLAVPEAASAAPLRLRYRLDGLDPDWLDAPDPPVLSYARIPPGSYRLLAEVESEQGWSGPRSILAIEVAPPWWERWYARTAAAMIVLLAMWGALLLRLRQLRQREAWLRAEVDERTEALRTQSAALTRTASALAEANARLTHLSAHDDLTGLANRREILAEAARMIQHSASARMPVVCALLDLDHFKQVNDQWGHSAGDAVLREFARRLRATLGAQDRAGRYGGEEFVVLLDGRNIDEAMAWAETLRASLASAGFPIGPGVHLVITVSIGLCERHWASELGLEPWIAMADAALYRAKAEGRNRAISAPGPA